METSATNRRLRTILTDIMENKLIPRPEFQRRLVWTNKHKEAFVETVLLGLPFPEIYIAAGEVDVDTGQGKEMLVDGQQRITTLEQYFKGSTDLVLKDVKPYSELDQQEKKAFLEYQVVTRDLGSKSIEEIKDIFTRINSTKYSLNAMETHNARFDGALKHFIEELAVDDFFDNNRVFSAQELRRMGDLAFCLTYVITILGGYFNRDALFGEWLAKYNDEFEEAESLRKNIKQVLTLIDAANFKHDSRIWRKADLLTVLVELYHLIFTQSVELTPDLIHDKLSSFFDNVEKAKSSVDDGYMHDEKMYKYYKAALQATNDRSNRVTRGEILRSFIQPEHQNKLAFD